MLSINNSSQNNNRNYAIGSSLGLLTGATIGTLSRNTRVLKEQLDTFIQNRTNYEISKINRIGDIIPQKIGKYLEINFNAAKDKQAVAITKKFSKYTENEKKYFQNFIKWENKVEKLTNKALKKQEPELFSLMEKYGKEFDKTELGKATLSKYKETMKSIKKTKLTWVTLFAIAGGAIGALGAYFVNKSAETPKETKEN